MDVILGLHTLFKDRRPFIFPLIRALEDTGLDYNPKVLEENLDNGMFFAIREVLPKNYPRKKAIKIEKEAEDLVVKGDINANKYLGLILDKEAYGKVLLAPETSGFTNKLLSKLNIRDKFDYVISKEVRHETIKNLLKNADVEKPILVTSSPTILKTAKELEYITIGLGDDLPKVADYSASSFFDVSTILEKIRRSS